MMRAASSTDKPGRTLTMSSLQAAAMVAAEGSGDATHDDVSVCDDADQSVAVADDDIADISVAHQAGDLGECRGRRTRHQRLGHRLTNGRVNGQCGSSFHMSDRCLATGCSARQPCPAPARVARTWISSAPPRDRPDRSSALDRFDDGRAEALQGEAHLI
jgi:hypothetical protein